MAKDEVGGGMTPFTAPELLVPSKFGLDKCMPSKEAKVYAIRSCTNSLCVVRCAVPKFQGEGRGRSFRRCCLSPRLVLYQSSNTRELAS